MNREFVLFIFVLFVSLAFFAEKAVCQAISVGFVDVPQQLNIVSSTHPAAAFIRAATADALTVQQQDFLLQRSYRLQLSDSLEVSPNYRLWSFRIKPTARFANGVPIKAEDVVDSIERCIQRNSKIVVVANARKGQRFGSEQWIDINVKKAPRSFYNAARLPIWLAGCPIYHRETAQLFGSHFGLGTNSVSSGSYYISDFREGKGYQLRAVDGSLTVNKHIEIKQFAASDRALTAVRLGDLDLLFLDSFDFERDSQVMEVAKKALTDETLVVSRCPNYIVILRKGLAFNCQSGIDISTLYYQK